MPKLCFFADASSSHTLKWISGCAELKWDITVISHWPGEIPGAKVIVHPLPLVGFPKYCWSVRRLVRKLKPDIIHAQQFGAHALYAWFCGVFPMVITAWGSDVLVGPKQSALLRCLIKFLIPRAALITAASPQISSDLLAYGAKPEQVVNIVFGIERWRYQKLIRAVKDEKRLIICSPRLHEPLYNIKTIIQSFQEVKKDFPHIELWVLGAGSLTAQLQHYVSTGEMSAGIHFWGRVTPLEFSERLAESHLMISIPSSDGTPVTMLEAMAAGCLPVVSDLPVYRDWITDGVNGFIVKQDVSELAGALRRGIEGVVLRRQAAEINREIIRERAIWEEQFQPMLRYYREQAAGGESCES